MIKHRKLYMILLMTLCAVILTFFCTIFFASSNSVNMSNIDEHDKMELYNGYLERLIEKQLCGMENVSTAAVIVNYEEVSEQHTIQIQLQTANEIDDEMMERYKIDLEKVFSDVVIIINGEELSNSV